MSFLVIKIFSHTIKSWDKSQVLATRTWEMSQQWAGKTKMGQFPALTRNIPCYSREFRWENISLLQLVMFLAIAGNITRPAKAFFTVKCHENSIDMSG